MAQIRKLMEDYTSKYFGISPSTYTDFEYHGESTSTNTIISTDIAIPLGVVTLYCIGIPLLQSFMKNRKAPNVRSILFIHNIFLCIASLYLLVFMVSTVLSYDTSYFNIFCALSREEQRGTLNWLYYLNLLLKYYELIDTVFLVIKKKPVTFLHGYHHPATLVFAWIIIMESPGMEWTVLVLNLAVHTIMYFYYAMSAIKVRMPGKQIITIMQIIQFVLDLAFVWYNLWDINLGPHDCNATNVSGWTATFILGSYLFLFLDFFKNAYCGSGKGKNKGKEVKDDKKLSEIDGGKKKVMEEGKKVNNKKNQ